MPGNPKPQFENDRVKVTEQAADCLAKCFRTLLERGEPRELAQRFILQMLVSLFAEDIDLLPKYFVTRVLEDCSKPTDGYDLIGGLFEAMNPNPPESGGRFKRRELLQRRFASQSRVEIHDIEPNQVAAKIERGETAVAPGVPRNYPDAKKLMTEDCIRPAAN